MKNEKKLPELDPYTIACAPTLKHCNTYLKPCRHLKSCLADRAHTAWIVWIVWITMV